VPEYSPDDPREWLRRARSNLAIAKADVPGLLTLVQQAGQSVPDQVKKAAQLTRFAVFTRYPGIARPVSREEYEQALMIAEEVTQWVESIILHP
jgi:HEPN domain-containing protein